MKGIVVTIFMLYCSMAMADNPRTQLVVWAKDGTKVAYALAEKPKITFTETDLVITANGLEVNYALENMARFTYEDNTETAITDLQTDKASFKLGSESLLFPALKANNTISLHTINGTLIFKKSIQKAGEYSFPLSNLKTGAYVVTVNGLTYKIVKR
ncbi:MAG: T9SS type A sorting domain-containing protein [Prevotella sp.]|nr:T9SS type A sorting domain-containing protein [Prevotella sp.]